MAVENSDCGLHHNHVTDTHRLSVHPVLISSVHSKRGLWPVALVGHPLGQGHSLQRCDIKAVTVEPKLIFNQVLK